MYSNLVNPDSPPLTSTPLGTTPINILAATEYPKIKVMLHSTSGPQANRLDEAREDLRQPDALRERKINAMEDAEGLDGEIAVLKNVTTDLEAESPELNTAATPFPERPKMDALAVAPHARLPPRHLHSPTPRL